MKTYRAHVDNFWRIAGLLIIVATLACTVYAELPRAQFKAEVPKGAVLMDKDITYCDSPAVPEVLGFHYDTNGNPEDGAELSAYAIYPSETPFVWYWFAGSENKLLEVIVTLPKSHPEHYNPENFKAKYGKPCDLYRLAKARAGSI